MREKFTRSELFHPQNTAGMEAHLEKMALQGKFLETIQKTRWHYRKGQPKALKYTVTYFKDGSIYNSETPQSLKDYYDFCATDGWNLVAESGAMQIFANEDPNATPIETDPVEKLENIHKISKKTIIFPGIFVIFLYGFLAYTQFSIYQMNRPEWLSGLHNFFVLIMMAVALIYMVASLLSYHSWYRRSKKSIEAGGDLIPSHGTAHRIMGWLYWVILLVLIFWYVLSSAVSNAVIYLCTIVMVFLYAFLFRRLLTWIKLLKKSKTFNMVTTIALYALSAMTISALLGYVVIRYDFSLDSRKPVGEVMFYDLTCPIYRDEIPLTLEDLYHTPLQNEETREARISQSFLLKQEEYIDEVYLPGSDFPELHYTLYRTDYPKIYDICKAQLLTDEEWEDEKFTPIDEALWNANAVYQKRNNYVLCYDTHLVELRLTQPPTAEEIEKIVDVLG